MHVITPLITLLTHPLHLCQPLNILQYNINTISTLFVDVHIYIYTVLSVNEYTPFEKYNFKQYLNEHKKHFQNVDKTKFNIISV